MFSPNLGWAYVRQPNSLAGNIIVIVHLAT